MLGTGAGSGFGVLMVQSLIVCVWGIFKLCSREFGGTEEKCLQLTSAKCGAWQACASLYM